MKTTTAVTAVFVLSVMAAYPGAQVPALAVAASSQNTTAPAQNITTQPDREFIQAVSASGRAEVAMAEAAQHRTMQPSVRQLAGRLLQDHHAINNDLMTIAKAKQIDIPATTETERATQQRLENLSGEAFDREYIAMMAKAHEASIARFMAAATSQDQTVKAFVDKTLPTLRAHQQEIESARKAIGGAETK